MALGTRGRGRGGPVRGVAAYENGRSHQPERHLGVRTVRCGSRGPPAPTGLVARHEHVHGVRRCPRSGRSCTGGFGLDGHLGVRRAELGPPGTSDSDRAGDSVRQTSWPTFLPSQRVVLHGGLRRRDLLQRHVVSSTGPAGSPDPTTPARPGRPRPPRDGPCTPPSGKPGGVRGAGGATSGFDDTWLFDGATWTAGTGRHSRARPACLARDGRGGPRGDPLRQLPPTRPGPSTGTAWSLRPLSPRRHHPEGGAPRRLRLPPGKTWCSTAVNLGLLLQPTRRGVGSTTASTGGRGTPPPPTMLPRTGHAMAFRLAPRRGPWVFGGVFAEANPSPETTPGSTTAPTWGRRRAAAPASLTPRALGRDGVRLEPRPIGLVSEVALRRRRLDETWELDAGRMAGRRPRPPARHGSESRPRPWSTTSGGPSPSSSAAVATPGSTTARPGCRAPAAPTGIADLRSTPWPTIPWPSE